MGTKCAEYIYDAWGNCTVTYDRYGISELNPIRYRGYYYDTETDLYYLGSRYYDPEIGRFINADVVFDNGAGILGYNLYAYCANNPVVNLDIAGFFLFAAIGAAVGAIGGAIVATLEGKSAKEIKAAAVSGAISGGISGGVMDILTVTGGSAILVASVCALGGFVGSLAGAMVENKMNGKNPWTWEVISTALIDAAWGAVFGAISGAMEDSITPMMKKVAASTGKKLQKKGITIGTAIWRTLRKEWINLWDTIISEGLTNFSYWYFEEKVDKMLEDY